MNEAFKRWAKERFGQDARTDEPMSVHTTLGVGGPADLFVCVRDTEGLVELVSRCNEEGEPFFILGGGSNLLVKDGGIRGVVIDMKKGWKDISVLSELGEEVTVEAGAGMWLQAACRYAIENGLSGMNFALGIPGSVGGAVVMNAGTASGTMADVVDAVEVVTSAGRVVRKRRDELDFSYRGFSIKGNGCAEDFGAFVITTVCLLLKRKDREQLRAEADGILRGRLESQPTDEKSAGCFFKNPASGEPAGKLIEMAGLKGMAIGGAAVSERHANFLVNRGKASASDFLMLMEAVRERVFHLFGVELEPEVVIVGQ